METEEKELTIGFYPILQYSSTPVLRVEHSTTQFPKIEAIQRFSQYKEKSK